MMIEQSSKGIIMKKFLLCALFFLLPILAIAETETPAEISKEVAADLKDKAAKTEAAEAPSGPEIVKVGIYLNDVQSIDTHANNYLLDFYMWFKWKNPESDPTASFEFMNHSESWATINTKPTEKAETLPDGWQYQVMHIQGRMSEKMNLRSYPFDKQNLIILMEDVAADINGLQYEIEEVSVNPALKIPGFEFGKATFKSDAYNYPTRFGDTRLTENGSYSRMEFKLPVYRNALTSFVKNILPIWLAVACAMFALMLHPRLIDSRFQIAVFSILSLVALQISNGNDLPALQYMNLMDALYVVGYIFLICLMAELIIATKWIEHDRETENIDDTVRAQKLDKKFGYIGGALFLIANFYLIFVAFK
jgi:hypothetical protein